MDGETLRLADGARLPLPSGHGLADGRKVVYGIRPQHIQLADSGIAAEVVLVEPTGEAQEVMLRLQTTDITMVLGESALLQSGVKVTIGFDTGNVLLFDDKTGGRIQ
ncbi:glycerol-3-phosphate transporter ATP-binding subunit [compost metagenome]